MTSSRGCARCNNARGEHPGDQLLRSDVGIVRRERGDALLPIRNNVAARSRAGRDRPTRDAADFPKLRASLVSSGVRLGEAVLGVLLARLVEGNERLAASGHLNLRLERRDDLIERVHHTVLYDPVRRCRELEV